MRDEVARRPRAAGFLDPIAPVVAMVSVMWGEELVDTLLDGRLDRFGIRPRRLDGLDGILFSPFLHGGLGHLIANTLPFLLLGAAICLGSTRRFIEVTLVVGLASGLGTWITGSSGSVHIGASGLVFGYLTYLISRGVFARKLTYIVGGILTFMLYGSALWGLVPRPGVSWEGHLFGALGGVGAAWLFHAARPDDADLA